MKRTEIAARMSDEEAKDEANLRFFKGRFPSVFNWPYVLQRIQQTSPRRQQQQQQQQEEEKDDSQFDGNVDVDDNGEEEKDDIEDVGKVEVNDNAIDNITETENNRNSDIDETESESSSILYGHDTNSDDEDPWVPEEDTDNDDDDDIDSVEQKKAPKRKRRQRSLPTHNNADTNDVDVNNTYTDNDDWVFSIEAQTPPFVHLIGYSRTRNSSSIDVFSMGDQSKIATLTQKKVDYLFHLWLSYLEKNAHRQRELLMEHLINAYNSQSKKFAAAKVSVAFNNSVRRPVGSDPKTLAHLKDRAVTNKMRPVLNHVNDLQKMTTFHSKDSQNNYAKSQHFLFTYDETIPHPHYSRSQSAESSREDPKKRQFPLSVFLLPDHCTPKELGGKLIDAGKKLVSNDHFGIRCVRDIEVYHQIVFGKEPTKTPKRKNANADSNGVGRATSKRKNANANSNGGGRKRVGRKRNTISKRFR